MSLFDPNVFTNLKRNTITTHTAVTAGFCDGVFPPETYERLRMEFPDVQSFKLVDKANSGGGHKRFYVGPDYGVTRHLGSVYHMKDLPGIWKELLKEVSSREFIESLSDATETEFNTLCDFGFTFGNEGCVQEPHLDGAIRPGETSDMKGVIAFLLYFNEVDDSVSATEIYDIDRKTILLKGTTMRNSWVFFKQHPHSWHGFPEVPKGHTRRLLSITYTNLPSPIEIDWSLSGQLKLKLKRLAERIKKRIPTAQ